MKKQRLVSEQQHHIVDGDIIKEISVSIYKGMTFRKAKFQRSKISEVVEIRAYRIEVEEVWHWENQSFHEEHQDFGFCTSRVKEYKLALKLIKRECSSLDDVRRLMAGLVDTFSAAMTGDAREELRRQIRCRQRKVTPALPHTQTN